MCRAETAARHPLEAARRTRGDTARVSVAEIAENRQVGLRMRRDRAGVRASGVTRLALDAIVIANPDHFGGGIVR